MIVELLIFTRKALDMCCSLRTNLADLELWLWKPVVNTFFHLTNFRDMGSHLEQHDCA